MTKPQGVRCHAHNSRNGEPCRKWAILGGKVCRFHGGGAKQVQASARQRLDEMVAPALAELRKLIATADSDSVKLAAIKDVLDRTGYKLPERLETDQAVTIRVEYESSPIADQVANSQLSGNLPRSTNGKAHVS